METIPHFLQVDIFLVISNDTLNNKDKKYKYGTMHIHAVLEVLIENVLNL